MQYSVEEIKQYAAEEDVKYIRMAFCDAAGRQKNIALMPGIDFNPGKQDDDSAC